jgi:hypothetical protein
MSVSLERDRGERQELDGRRDEVFGAGRVRS